MVINKDGGDCDDDDSDDDLGGVSLEWDIGNVQCRFTKCLHESRLM